ncbi:unnamed protein product [Urochloa decumbens]|uniref:KIB1-4 beta-propeller domain-containing protein n=1 Tax=Urochloa decumbens TaxID=240449 RepID=A0ABC9B9J1_9POAL
MASTTGSRTGRWAELPADLLGCVVARLPYPGDRAAICAACRWWRSAARRFVRHQPPWIVLPDCTFCTTGHDGGAFFGRIPGLPAAENATCLAAAGEGWLALDLTDDALRRTPFMDTYCPDTRTFRDARPDVKHAHSYLLHNPFSGETVPLPELDDLGGGRLPTPRGGVREEDGVNREVPYDATDETYTARYLVRSLSGELLLVRHGRLSSPYLYPYTLNVEVFKPDLSAGRWVPVDGDDGLGEGEALFLSRSFSRSTRAHGGDVKDGFVYYAATIGQENAFDTRSRTIQQMALRRPWQWEEAQDHLLTWLFPPELVV